MADSARIITLPGDPRSFVVGMHWEYHGSRKPRKSTVKAIANAEGTWVAQRRGRAAIQTGYCHPLEDKLPKSGLYALAAMVADAKTEPWMGVYDLGDGLYWFIAVRENNSVLPEGDFVGTKEEVEEMRQATASLSEWNEFPEESAEAITALLEETKSKVRIDDINHKAWTRPIVAAAVVGIAATTGTVLYHQHEHRLKLAHERAIIHERAVIAAMQKAHSKKTPLPWTRMTTPSGVLSACRDDLDSLPVAVGGWTPSKETCQATGPVVRARLNWVPGPDATANTAPQGQLSLNGKVVTDQLPPRRLAFDSSSHLEPAQPEIKALYAMTASLGVKVHLSKARITPKRTTLPGEKRKAVVHHRKPWREYRVSMLTKLPVLTLDGFGSQLDSIPGLRLKSISTQAHGAWKLTGVLYASRHDTSGRPRSP